MSVMPHLPSAQLIKMPIQRDLNRAFMLLCTQALFRRGKCNLQLGILDEARSDLERVSDSHPHSWRLWQYMLALR